MAPELAFHALIRIYQKTMSMRSIAGFSYFSQKLPIY